MISRGCLSVDVKLENDRAIVPKKTPVIAVVPGKEVFLQCKYKWKSSCETLGKGIVGETLGTFKYSHV